MWYEHLCFRHDFWFRHRSTLYLYIYQECYLDSLSLSLSRFLSYGTGLGESLTSGVSLISWMCSSSFTYLFDFCDWSIELQIDCILLAVMRFSRVEGEFKWMFVLFLVCLATAFAYKLFGLSELSCFESSERFYSAV